MFSIQLTYKRQILIGWFALVILLFSILGRVSEIETIKGELSPLKSKLVVIEDSDRILLEQNEKLANLDQQIRKQNFQRKHIHSHLDFIEYIESLALELDLVLLTIPNQKLLENGDYQVSNISFSVKGGYHDLIQLIYRIEYVDRVASFEEVDFMISYSGYGTSKKQVLHAELIMNRLMR